VSSRICHEREKLLSRTYGKQTNFEEKHLTNKVLLATPDTELRTLSVRRAYGRMTLNIERLTPIRHSVQGLKVNTNESGDLRIHLVVVANGHAGPSATIDALLTLHRSL
jgi:hypothetical protein